MPHAQPITPRQRRARALPAQAAGRDGSEAIDPARP
jgi:hypothetical protein